MSDDFNDGVIDPQWQKVFGYVGNPATGATINETGGQIETFTPLGQGYKPVGLKLTNFVNLSNLDVAIDVIVPAGFRLATLIVGAESAEPLNSLWATDNHYRIVYWQLDGNYYITVTKDEGGTESTVLSQSTTFASTTQLRIVVSDGLAFFYLGVTLLNPTGDPCDWLHQATGDLVKVEFSVQTTGATNQFVYFDNYIETAAALVPIASFTQSSDVVPVGVVIYLDASSSIDYDGLITNYAWDFGDGNIGTGITPAYTYTLEGTYTITLTVTDNDGLTDTMSSTITVLANQPPTANFTMSTTTPRINEVVTFDASTSSDPDGTIISYAWDFGDDTTDSGISVNHSYTSEGTYTMTLTVTDDGGLTDTIMVNITVTEAPPLPCWIATATYGSPLAPELFILRQFRDKFMLKTLFGKGLVKLYYLTSPPIAKLISHHKTLKLITQQLLDKITSNIRR